jgi:PhnB protein
VIEWGTSVAGVSIYLNYMGDTEEAFNLYRSVFGGEFTAFQRLGEVPADPSSPQLTEDERQMVMHVELPILDGTKLMGTDMLESMGHELRLGNNITISLELDDLADANQKFAALSEGGSDVVSLAPMFWGAHWGVCCDPFGVRWMFNVPDAPA